MKMLLVYDLMETWFMYEFEPWNYDYEFHFVTRFVTNDRNKSITTLTVLRFESPAVTPVVYPPSNCQAVVGIKTIKQFITKITGPNGGLDTDFFHRAILRHWNAPDPQR